MSCDCSRGADSAASNRTGDECLRVQLQRRVDAAATTTTTAILPTTAAAVIRQRKHVQVVQIGVSGTEAAKQDTRVTGRRSGKRVAPSTNGRTASRHHLPPAQVVV